MSTLDQGKTHPQQTGEAGRDQLDVEKRPSSQEPEKSGHSRWMMLACCVPMLVIAIALVATGVVGAGFILVALACTAMMGMMMIGMSGGGR